MGGGEACGARLAAVGLKAGAALERCCSLPVPRGA